MEWIKYLDLEVNGFHREDFYLAQIAAEVCRTRAKRPRDVKTEDFVLKFKYATKREGEETTTEASKNFWLTLAKHGKRPPKKKSKEKDHGGSTSR